MRQQPNSTLRWAQREDSRQLRVSVLDLLRLGDGSRARTRRANRCVILPVIAAMLVACSDGGGGDKATSRPGVPPDKTSVGPDEDRASSKAGQGGSPHARPTAAGKDVGSTDEVKKGSCFAESEQGGGTYELVDCHDASATARECSSSPTPTFLGTDPRALRGPT